MSEQTDNADLPSRIQQAFDRLPPRRQDILLAIRREDLTFVQVAERHGIAVADVERELTRALVALVDAADGRRPTWRQLLLRLIRRSAVRPSARRSPPGACGR